MNKYNVFRNLLLLAMIVNLLAMIGTDLGWFNWFINVEFYWVNFCLLLLAQWVEKMSAYKAKGEKAL